MSLAWRITSVRSSTGITSVLQAEIIVKNGPLSQQSVVFSVLNNKLIAALLGLAPSYLPRPYSLRVSAHMIAKFC